MFDSNTLAMTVEYICKYSRGPCMQNRLNIPPIFIANNAEKLFTKA